MTINWYGQSCFKIQEGQRTVLLDPYGPKKYGLRGPQLKASVILVTDPDDVKETQKKLKEKSFLVSGPGEYEVKDIVIYGIFSPQKKESLTIYHFEISGIKFGTLGEIDRALTDEELESLDGVEVLFVPVGGKTVMSGKGAIEIINALEPKLAIPTCFKIPKLKADLFSVSPFLKEVGKKQVEKMNKLTLKRSSLPREGTKIVVLQSGG
ncbi:MBL fold metallo-hydrolase [Patescibacteria group bacterium AH-259-L05]|nr:MBL fold metallo-hydrolase [Patescibacteria group bacterium AH-259-L05]